MQISTNGILEGKSIHLVPMEDSHKTELSSVLMSPEIWEFTWRTITASEEIDHVLTNDNVFYSIIDTEWPNVKENLHYLLAIKYSER
jgi:hypothetical protein